MHYCTSVAWFQSLLGALHFALRSRTDFALYYRRGDNNDVTAKTNRST
jgi:hypothetical protein